MLSEEDTCAVHFPHNDILIVNMHIDNCRVSRTMVDNGSSDNILYKGALDRMEDTPEAARAMINPQSLSNLYEFDENETRSSGMISLSVRADPYNIITEFFVMMLSPCTKRSVVNLGSI